MKNPQQLKVFGDPPADEADREEVSQRRSLRAKPAFRLRFGEPRTVSGEVDTPIDPHPSIATDPAAIGGPAGAPRESVEADAEIKRAQARLIDAKAGWLRMLTARGHEETFQRRVWFWLSVGFALIVMVCFLFSFFVDGEFIVGSAVGSVGFVLSSTVYALMRQALPAASSDASRELPSDRDFKL